MIDGKWEITTYSNKSSTKWKKSMNQSIKLIKNIKKTKSHKNKTGSVPITSCFMKHICQRGDCKTDIAEDDCLMYTSFSLMSHRCLDMLANVNPKHQ